MSSDTLPTIRGIIFDMDGTLTVPNHDFKLMYERVGCVTSDILSEIETWDLERQKKANAIIHEMEMVALEGMTVMPFAAELGAFLDAAKIPRGLVTRNVDKSVEHFHTEHWCKHEKYTGLAPFSPALSREFKPYKPAPDALLKICQEWNLHPSEVMMVGDSAKDDVVSGNRAGCVTVLLDQSSKWRLEGNTEEGDEKVVDNGVEEDNMLRGDMVPTFIVSCLSQITPLLCEKYELKGRE
jgi:phosphoglycolate phosphatase-like HAD superfamily hydrolase